FNIYTDFMRERALRYLAADNRLAVIASLSETFSFTVAECGVNGLPFIAAETGGTSEVIPEPAFQQGVFFKPTSRDLDRCLSEDFRMAPARRQALRPRAPESVEPAIRNATVIAVYDQVLDRYRQESNPRLTLSTGAILRESLELTDALAECEDEDIDPELGSSEPAETQQMAEYSGREPSIVAMPGPFVTVAVAHY